MYDVNRIPYPSAVHPRFNLGRVFDAPASGELGLAPRLRECLARHVRGDWGIVTPDAAKSNECALRHGKTLRSVYALDPALPCSETRNCVWIVTDIARGETAIVLSGVEGAR
jgi:hypothetical protein